MNVKQIYKSFNNSVCKNTSGTRGMCQRMKAVTMQAMSNRISTTMNKKNIHTYISKRQKSENVNAFKNVHKQCK